MITSSWAARWSSSPSASARRESLARWATSSRAIGMVVILGARPGGADWITGHDRPWPWLTAAPRSASGAAAGTTGGGARRGRAYIQQQPQPGLVQDRHTQAERLVVL